MASAKKELQMLVNKLVKEKKITKSIGNTIKLLADDYADVEWRRGALHGFYPK